MVKECSGNFNAKRVKIKNVTKIKDHCELPAKLFWIAS